MDFYGRRSMSPNGADGPRESRESGRPGFADAYRRRSPGTCRTTRGQRGYLFSTCDGTKNLLISFVRQALQIFDAPIGNARGLPPQSTAINREIFAAIVMRRDVMTDGQDVRHLPQ